MLRIMIIHLISSVQHQLLVQMVVFQWHRKLSSVTMPPYKEIWKFSAYCYWTLPYAAYDWDQIQSQLLGLACLLKAGLASRISHWFPGSHGQTLGLLPCSHSPPSSLRLVCALALCPVHYAQVWLLATTFLTPTLGFVGIPSATWGILAFPITCKNDSLHFAPSLDGFHGVSGFTEPADLHGEAILSSFSWHHSTCTINAAFTNYGGGGPRGKAPSWQGLKAFSF